jgi:UDP-GlcNAc3NAcA epimerase
MHPRTRGVLQRSGQLNGLSSNILVIDPVGYLDMVQLEKNAAVIATDSGGIQKEAFFHRVPCVTLRMETEWIELVESGWNQLVKRLDSRTVQTSIKSMIGRRGADVEPYGKGDAANKILVHLLKDLKV